MSKSRKNKKEISKAKDNARGGAIAPFGAFREEMDQLIDNFFGDRGSLASFPSMSKWLGETKGLVAPSVDIKENDKTITLTAELPGMSADDIELTVQNGMVTLKGEKKFERDEEKDEVHVSERRYGSFRRSFYLPDSVDEDAIDAKFDGGLLKVTMQKSPDANKGRRKIEIK
ncbi:MAG: Hsp20/alpha crystallin family protein [Fimbriimonadaceae bacterium]|nr:Hsp20/alpha crystallin family protein [Alphaproteobacteria bacterium]